MNIGEFSEKPDKQKLDILQQEGAYVGKRQTGKGTALLYQLAGFYVEVVYRNYRKDIDSIKVSPSLDLLKPYLDQVKVNGLINMENEK